MARIISIANQKGGVGKTTTAINTAVFLAAHGKRTLLLDLDPQANATSGLGTTPSEIEKSIYFALIGKVFPEEIIRRTSIFGFDLIPSSQDLAGLTVELVNQKEREFLLEKMIRRLKDHYDFILIDCPPSLCLLTINGIVAAKELIIPVQCEYYALDGLNQLLNTVDLISKNLDQGPEFKGALLTLFDKRNRLDREVVKEVRRNFPGYVFDAVIPRNISLAEAPKAKKTIFQYAPESYGANAYRQLAQEIINLK